VTVTGTWLKKTPGVAASMDAMATERLEQLLRTAFPDAEELRVEDRTGDGDHFQVIVTSARFDGLPLLDQHRLVNAALAEPLRDGTIHELRIKTRVTEKGTA
jgi:stress-induced morphogen